MELWQLFWDHEAVSKQIIYGWTEKYKQKVSLMNLLNYRTALEKFWLFGEKAESEVEV